MLTPLIQSGMPHLRFIGRALTGITLTIAIAGFGDGILFTAQQAEAFTIPVEFLDQLDKLPGDLAPLPNVPVPKDNPQSSEKVELGKMLFFDKRLSGDHSMSCASCHAPDKGYADGKKRAIGFGGQELGRHSPTVLNAAYNTAQFWDGRAATLEDQAKGPIEAAGEMNLDRKELIKRLNGIPEYKKRFNDVFGKDPTFDNVAKAIAAFERTVVTTDSRFDLYMRGDKQALTLPEKRGLSLFVSKASCSQCHNGVNFTDNGFYTIGVTQEGPLSEDLGRYSLTQKEEDREAFKTPTLRNIALTAPYMHNGALETLEEVVEFYNQGGGTSSNQSDKVIPLELTGQEKEDLIAFLMSLTGGLPKISTPKIPRS